MGLVGKGGIARSRQQHNSRVSDAVYRTANIMHRPPAARPGCSKGGIGAEHWESDRKWRADDKRARLFVGVVPRVWCCGAWQICKEERCGVEGGWSRRHGCTASASRAGRSKLPTGQNLLYVFGVWLAAAAVRITNARDSYKSKYCPKTK